MHQPSSLIRHPADRWQVALAVAGPVAMLVPFFVSLPVLAELGLWLTVWLFLCRHNYILHNHVHRPFARSKYLNRSLSIALGFCTGMTSGNWKITHVHGHHIEHKRFALERRPYLKYFAIADNEEFTFRSALRHVARTAPLQWYIPLREMVKNSYFGRGYRKRFYLYYLAEFVFIYSFVIALTVWQPTKGIAYFGGIYLLVYFTSRYVDYVTHVDSLTPSKYSFANVCLDPRYNRAFWNFGYHVAHHIRPTAHWTTLPLIYKSLPITPDSTVAAQSPNFIGLLHPVTHDWRRVADSPSEDV